jgi:hypothetical protein
MAPQLAGVLVHINKATFEEGADPAVGQSLQDCPRWRRFGLFALLLLAAQA